MDDVKMGQRIKDLRTAKGIFQRELAAALAVDNTSVSQYERGQRRPSFEALVKLARLLDVSVESLLGMDKGKQYVPLTGLTESQVASVMGAVNEMTRLNQRLYDAEE